MFEQAWAKNLEEVKNSVKSELEDNFSKAGAESLNKAKEFCLICSDCTFEQAQAVFFILSLKQSAEAFFKSIESEN